VCPWSHLAYPVGIPWSVANFAWKEKFWKSALHPLRRQLTDRVRIKWHSTSWFQTLTVFWMLYAFFWVILRRLNFICQGFGTLCLFHLHRRVGMSMKMEQTECSETLAYKIQTPGNYPEESIQRNSTLYDYVYGARSAQLATALWLLITIRRLSANDYTVEM